MRMDVSLVDFATFMMPEIDRAVRSEDAKQEKKFMKEMGAVRASGEARPHDIFWLPSDSWKDEWGTATDRLSSAILQQVPSLAGMTLMNSRILVIPAHYSGGQIVRYAGSPRPGYVTVELNLGPTTFHLIPYMGSHVVPIAIATARPDSNLKFHDRPAVAFVSNPHLGRMYVPPEHHLTVFVLVMDFTRPGVFAPMDSQPTSFDDACEDIGKQPCLRPRFAVSVPLGTEPSSYDGIVAQASGRWSADDIPAEPCARVPESPTDHLPPWVATDGGCRMARSEKVDTADLRWTSPLDEERPTAPTHRELSTELQAPPLPTSVTCGGQLCADLRVQRVSRDMCILSFEYRSPGFARWR